MSHLPIRSGETVDAYIKRTHPTGAAAKATDALTISGNTGGDGNGGQMMFVNGVGFDVSTPAGLQNYLLALESLDDSSSSGGFAPPTFGQTREGFEFQAAQDTAARIAGEVHDGNLLGIRNKFEEAQQKRDNAFAKGEREKAQTFQAEMDRLQREFQKVEAQKDRDFQKEMKKEELKAERQRIFVDMMGKDPVRATLFALGIGGSILPGGERFDDLPALKGAKQQEVKTETALNRLLAGTTQGTTNIDLGSSGVTGLPPAIKSARAFQEAGSSGQKVLSSAFGVGDIRAGKQPGINPEEFLQLIDSVTPKGALQG